MQENVLPSTKRTRGGKCKLNEYVAAAEKVNYLTVLFDIFSVKYVRK